MVNKNRHKFYNISLSKKFNNSIDYNKPIIGINSHKDNSFSFKVVSFNSKLLNRLNKVLNLFLFNVTSENGNKVVKINLPTKIKKYTVLKSPHVNKKARDQFEIRTYKSYFKLLKYNSKEITLTKNLFKILNNNYYYKIYLTKNI